jgi:choline dehydrogenase-like flavoprotein
MTPTAIIVGSGISGSIFARVLARSGAWDVVVLEKGRNLFSGLGSGAVGNVFVNDEVGYQARTAPFMQDPLLEPRTFRSDPSAGIRSHVGAVQFLPTTVGGGTVHYDAKLRRFREVDFIANSLMGGSPGRPAIAGTTYTDWPVTYSEMEPFYAVVEEILGVQGAAVLDGGWVKNPNPYESWRSTPFPMGPGVDMLSGLLVADSARRLGYTPAAAPTGINSRPYRGRPACVDCGFCIHYGCPINARSSGVWPLHDALATGRARLVSDANVVGVEFTNSGKGGFRATAVVYLDAEGRTRGLAGDLVVLANTPIEATRLSIRSGISRPPEGSDVAALRPASSEPSGLLGRNLMFHYQTIAIAVVDRDIHPGRGRSSTHTVDAFAGSGPSAEGFDPGVPRGGVVEAGGHYDPVTAADALPGRTFGRAHKRYMEIGPFSRRLLSLTMQGEDMPQLTNYVDLDPEVVDVFGEPVPRITYRSHPYEREASAYYGPRLLELLEGVGARGSAYDVHPLLAAVVRPAPEAVEGGAAGGTGGPADDVPDTAHIMGTHRAALRPEGGPCDPFGRYWAFDNLYHAGGGLFCTAPGFNVTLTMAALAYRSAAAVLVGVGPRGSYSADDVAESQTALERVVRRLDGATMIAGVLGGR